MLSALVYMFFSLDFSVSRCHRKGPCQVILIHTCYKELFSERVLISLFNTAGTASHDEVACSESGGLPLDEVEKIRVCSLFKTQKSFQILTASDLFL